MIQYSAGALLAVASPGGHEAITEDALIGKMRSRSGAILKYTQNDICALKKHMPTYGSYCDGELVSYDLLNPSIEELYSTVKEITNYLKEAACEDGRKKVFNIIYAGHGKPENGEWELRDGVITGKELHEIICSIYFPCNNILHLDLILDSCYSSRFLIDLMVSSQNHKTVYPFDCIASSLPDEVSWEMEFLEHGAMSFHLTHEGNSYVNQKELAKAVDNKELRVIFMALQGITVPNPVAFLTNGRQHCVELTSGHHLKVQGSGSIELGDHLGKLTHAGISNSLNIAKTAYGEEVNYERLTLASS